MPFGGWATTAKMLNIDPAAYWGAGAFGWRLSGKPSAGCCVDVKPKAIVSFYRYGDIIGDWYAKPDPHYLKDPHVTEAEARAVVGTAPLSKAR